jgi:hypothetical protein
VNRRQEKKACKKAAAHLAQEFPGEFEIVPAEGDETVSAPRRFEPPAMIALGTMQPTARNTAHLRKGELRVR